MSTTNIDRPFDIGSYLSFINKTVDSVAAQAIVSNTIANPTVVTVEGHGIVSGRNVTISGNTTSTPLINGLFEATVLTADTFTIPVNVTVAGSDGTLTTEVGTLDQPRHVTYYSDAALQITAISIASPAIITFATKHLLFTGEYVFIENTDCTPSLNGGRFVTVVSETTISVGVTTTGAGTTGQLSAEKLIRRDTFIDGYDANGDPIYLGNVIQNSTFSIADGKMPVSDPAIVKAGLTNNLFNLPALDTRFAAINAAGHTTTLISTFTDINDSGNTNWVMPAVAETLSIVSDDAADAPAGAGIFTILLQGLDTGLNPIIDVVVLAGTTPVLSNIAFRSMHLAIALAGGTPGSGAAGTITMTSTVDAASWGAFLPNDTSAETGRLVCPTDQRYLILGTTLSGGGGADITIKSEVTVLGTFPISLAEIYVTQGVFPIDNIIPIFIETGTLIKFRGFTNSGSPATRKLSATLALVGGTVADWDSIMYN